MKRTLLFSTCAFALGLTLAPAAIVVSNATSATPAGGGTTLTWSQTITTGNDSLLVVGFGYENVTFTALSVSSVTYGGVNLTQAVLADANTGAGTNSNVSALYYLLNPALGAADVIVTLSVAPPGAASIFGGSLQADGINQSNPLGTTNAATALSSTSVTSNYTLGSGVDYLVVDFVDHSSAGVGLTGSNSQTELNFGNGTGSSADLGYRLQTGTGAATSSTWTSPATAVRFALATAAFQAVPEPGTASLLIAASASLCLLRNRRKS